MADPKPEIRIFDDAETLARAAATEFADRAIEAVAARGRFTVALSGGSTPRRLYETLVGAPPSGRPVPWEGIHLFWGDERHVPPGHRDSNYRMVREALLDRIALPEDQVHRVPAGSGPVADAASAYENDLRTFFSPPGDEPPRFDLVLLGLGADGHTASLFPGTKALWETERWVVGHRIEGVATERVTFTFPLINNAAAVLFLVSGRDKADALRDVLSGEGTIDRIPASGVHPTHGSLVWLADREAAGSRPA